MYVNDDKMLKPHLDKNIHKAISYLVWLRNSGKSWNTADSLQPQKPSKAQPKNENSGKKLVKGAKITLDMDTSNFFRNSLLF